MELTPLFFLANASVFRSNPAVTLMLAKGFRISWASPAAICRERHELLPDLRLLFHPPDLGEILEQHHQAASGRGRQRCGGQAEGVRRGL